MHLRQTENKEKQPATFYPTSWDAKCCTSSLSKHVRQWRPLSSAGEKLIATIHNLHHHSAWFEGDAAEVHVIGDKTCGLLKNGSSLRKHSCEMLSTGRQTALLRECPYGRETEKLRPTRQVNYSGTISVQSKIVPPYFKAHVNHDGRDTREWVWVVFEVGFYSLSCFCEPVTWDWVEHSPTGAALGSAPSQCLGLAGRAVCSGAVLAQPLKRIRMALVSKQETGESGCDILIAKTSG